MNAVQSDSVKLGFVSSFFRLFVLPLSFAFNLLLCFIWLWLLFLLFSSTLVKNFFCLLLQTNTVQQLRAGEMQSSRDKSGHW